MNAVPLTKMRQHQFAPAEDPAPHPWATTLFLPSTETGSSSALSSCNILLY